MKLKRLWVGIAPIILVWSLLSLSAPAWAQEVQLAIYTIPPILPADGGAHQLVLQLQDTNGRPIPAHKDIRVSLASSRPDIIRVASEVIIPKGASYITTRLMTGLQEGSSLITAAAPDFLPTSKELRTLKPGGIPLQLRVKAIPSTIRASPTERVFITIQLLDANQKPIEASEDLPVRVQITAQGMIPIVRQLLIPAGQAQITFPFSPTYRPRNYSVTAQAEGFPLASATFSSIGPSFTRLAVEVAPNEISLGRVSGVGEERAKVTVMLLDEEGRLARANADVAIRLTVNNTAIGALASSVITIPRGSAFGSTEFIPRGLGIAKITAEAPGAIVTSATIKVIDAQLVRSGFLRIFFSPSKLLPHNLREEAIFVQLVQQVQEGGRLVFKAVAAGENVVVKLSSSDPELVDVDSEVLIRRGRTFAAASIKTSFKVGDVTISAVAKNFSATSEVLTVQGNPPARLALFSLADELPSNFFSRNGLVVQLQDARGNPAIAPFNIPVSLSFSPQLVELESSVTILAGHSFATIDLATGEAGGTVSITATSPGLQAGTLQMTVRGALIPQLRIEVIPPIIPALKEAQLAAIIEVLDATGRPLSAPKDIVATLTSSSSSVASLPPTFNLKKGQVYAILPLETGPSGGSATLSVHAEGVLPSSFNLQVVNYPLEVKLVALADVARLGEELPIQLVVSSGGLPVEGATIIWDVEGAQAIRADEASDEEGRASLLLLANRIGDIFVRATVLKELHVTGDDTITIPVELLPLLIKSDAPNAVTVGVRTKITILVQTGGEPVAGAEVSWSTDLGALLKPELKTNEEGRASAIFVSEAVGAANVRVDVRKMGYQEASLSFTIQVQPVILLPLTLNITAQPLELEAGGVARISLRVLHRGAAVEGANVKWSTTLGEFLNLTNITDAEGSATATITSPLGGLANVTVTVSKEGYRTDVAGVGIRFIPKPLKMELSAEERKFQVGGFTRIHAIVTVDGRPVMGANVTFSASAGKLSETSILTDEEGRVVVVFTHNQPERISITAKASKEGYEKAEASLRLSVLPKAEEEPAGGQELPSSPFGPEFMGVPLLAIVLPVGAGVGLVLFIRRRRSAGPPLLEEEEEI